MTTSSLPERKGRSVRLFGRNYPVLLPSLRDPRLHVAAVLLTLQLLGQTVLDFRLSIAQILICLAVGALIEDRKSTRLNSSHRCISYAVFCLKKKTNTY